MLNRPFSTERLFTDIQKKLDALHQRLTSIEKRSAAPPPPDFVDNNQFMDLMKLSRRTAQTWRDEGIIPYYMIGAKIYYKISDIEALLEKNKIERADERGE